MTELSDEELRVLRSIETVRAADAVPHTQALLTETGLRSDVLEQRLDGLLRRGLVTIEGAGGTDRSVQSMQPFYWLTDAGRRVLAT